MNRSIERPADRRARIEVLLRNRLVDLPDGIPPLPAPDEVDLVAADEVARRALAIFLTAARAESFVSGQPLRVETVRARCPIAFAALSTEEVAFFQTPSPIAEVIDEFGWRYEALATLQWAMGWTERLPWPDERADLERVTVPMVEQDHAEIVASSKLRAIDELVDAAELHYLLEWAIGFAQHQGQETPAGCDAGVVTQRWMTLRWVLGWGEFGGE